MTKKDKDTTTVVLTFKKGQDFPVVTMGSHLYIDLPKIEYVKNIMTSKFQALANDASREMQAERRKLKAEERKKRVDPGLQAHRDSVAALESVITENIRTEMTEMDNG